MAGAAIATVAIVAVVVGAGSGGDPEGMVAGGAAAAGVGDRGLRVGWAGLGRLLRWVGAGLPSTRPCQAG